MDPIALFAIAFFGVGGVIALAVVPWICMGTGLSGKEPEYV